MRHSRKISEDGTSALEVAGIPFMPGLNEGITNSEDTSTDNGFTFDAKAIAELGLSITDTKTQTQMTDYRLQILERKRHGRPRGLPLRRMTAALTTKERMRTVRLKASITTLALLTLVACGSSDGEKTTTVPSDQVIKPQSGETAWKTTSVDGVEITLPDDLEKTGPISPGDDAVMFTFQTKVNSFGTQGGVQLATLPKSKKPAAKLADTIITQAKATIGATETKKVHIVWPGAEDAWFVTYVAQVPKGSKEAPHPAEVLILDLPGGGQSQATVTALEDDFASDKMHEILQTLKVTKTAGAKKS